MERPTELPAGRPEGPEAATLRRVRTGRLRLAAVAVVAWIAVQALFVDASPATGGRQPPRADRSAGVRGGAAPDSSRWLGGYGDPSLFVLPDTIDCIALYQGDLITGGVFTHCGNAELPHIVRWDDASWASLGGGLPAPVRAAIIYNGDLVVGGDFRYAGQVLTNYIAQWDGSNWAELGSPWAPGITSTSPSPVRALAVYQGKLIAAGAFSSAGGISTPQIAAWDGTQWSALGAGLDGDGPDVAIDALAVSGDTLIAAGTFTRSGEGADSISVNRTARWDGTSWHPLESEQRMQNGLDGAVRALCFHGGKLYAGGSFTNAGGVQAPFLASWDGTGWQAVGPAGGPGLNGDVTSLASIPGGAIPAGIAIGGGFTSAGGVPASHIALWDGKAWSHLAEGLPGAPQELLVDGERLIAAGGAVASPQDLSQSEARRSEPRRSEAIRSEASGSEAGPSEDVAGSGDTGSFSPHGLGDGRRRLLLSGAGAVGYLLSWDGVSWGSPVKLGLGMDGDVSALCVISDSLGDELVAGGGFSSAGGVSAGHIARWNGTTWAPIGTGLDGEVTALAEFGGGMVAGGSFSDGTKLWNGSGWQNMGDGLSAGSKPASILTLAVYHGALYAAGQLSGSGSTALSNIAYWDGATWQSPGGGVGETKDNDEVCALIPYAGKLIAGGAFTTVGGGAVAARSLAAWDATTQEWSSIGDLEGAGGSGPVVHALAVQNGHLIVAGEFSEVGGVACKNIAQWDGTTWSPFGPPAGFDGPVLSLTVFGGALVAGGTFTTIGGSPAVHLAGWDGSSWQPLGAGADDDVLSLVEFRGDLVAGGTFENAGGIASSRIAFWHEQGVMTCSFPAAYVGDTLSAAIHIDNPFTSPAAISAEYLPSTVFSFSRGFRDSLNAGELEIAGAGETTAWVRFAPPDSGLFSDHAIFDLASRPVGGKGENPVKTRQEILLSGEGRRIRLNWTSEDVYNGHPIDPNQSASILMTLGDYDRVDSLMLWYAPGGSRAYQAVRMTQTYTGRNDRYAAGVPAEVAGPRGIEFYVSAHRGGSRSLVYSALHPAGIRVTVNNLVFPAPEPSGVYKTISFPLVLNRNRLGTVLGDNLEAQDPTRWRMFDYDADSASCHELSEASDPLVQGQGYWLITRDPVRLDTAPEYGVSTPTDSAFVLSLKPGWNLIGNPFDFPVAWDSLTARADTAFVPVGNVLSRPVWWDPSRRGYVEDIRVLEPFEGYFVRGVAGRNVLVRIPPVEADSGASAMGEAAESGGATARLPGSGGSRVMRAEANGTMARSAGALGRGIAGAADRGIDGGVGRTIDSGAADGGGWTLQVIASSGSARDEINYVGVRLSVQDAGVRASRNPTVALSGAESADAGQSGFNPADAPEPPLPPDNGISLYFPHADWGSESGLYRSEFHLLPPASDPTVSGVKAASDAESSRQLWYFDVAAAPSEQAEEWASVEIHGLSGLGPSWRATLVDRDLGRAVDFTSSAEHGQDPKYDFVLAKRRWVSRASECRFELCVTLVGDGRPSDPAEAPPAGTGFISIRPNPSAGSTCIRFGLARSGPVRLEVIDVRGARIKSLLDTWMDPGRYELLWDGTGESGRRAPEGVYFVRIQAGAIDQAHKVLLAR